MKEQKDNKFKRIYDKYDKAIRHLQDTVYPKAEENARFLRGQHWTEDEINAHTLEGYKAYSIPLIATKLNRVLAVQRTNRFDSKCFGRSPEDELGAEVKNYLIKYVLDYNKFKYSESDTYRDGLCKKYGVMCAEPNYEDNPEGEISMHRDDWREFYWDTNAKEYDLSDATFMGTVKWIPKDEVLQLYPDFEFEHAELGKNYEDTYGSRTDWCDPDKEDVKIVTHFERTFKKRFLCKNIKTGEFDVYETKQDAEEALALKTEMLMQELSQEDSIELTASADDFQIITRTQKAWEKIVFSGKNVIAQENWRYSRPPYFRYACFEDDGEIWSLTDLARDPQKMFDRMTTMIDKSTAKNIKGNNYQAVVNELHEKHVHDLDGLMRGLSAGGQVVLVNRKDAISPLESRNNIQVEGNLVQMYQGYIEDILGGRAFQGLETAGSQTATEVAITENNAKQVTSLFLDNLARWKLSLTEYLLELIDDVFSKDRKIRIMGETRTQEVTEAMGRYNIYEEAVLGKGLYAYLNIGNLPKPLNEYKVDVQIDDVTATTLDRQSKFEQLLAVNQIAVTAYGQPLPFEFILQYANVDPTVRAGLIKYQEQAEANLQKQKQLAETQAKVQGLSQLASMTKPDPPPEQKGTPTVPTNSGGNY